MDLLNIIKQQIIVCEDTHDDIGELSQWIDLKNFILKDDSEIPSVECVDNTINKLFNSTIENYNKLLSNYISEQDSVFKSEKDKLVALFLPEFKKIKLAKNQFDEFLKQKQNKL